ncbi:MAG: hypothetical protein GX556_17085 [Fibrobacter sp.]|nr:hypothetical protein [Fibrobacter sp.]
MRRINPVPIVCLLFIILISLFVIMQFKIAAGPFWLGQNSDPDYQYLLNSLNIAQGKGVGHTDHPRTPVQISGAILLKLSAPTAPVISLQENVLRKDEPPQVLQQAELVTSIIEKTEHRGNAYWCTRCKCVHYAPIPAEVHREGYVPQR